MMFKSKASRRCGRTTQPCILLKSLRELISKIRIGFDGKASADEKAQHTREYVSILNRQITPPSDVRRFFEMSSKKRYSARAIENQYIGHKT